MKNRISMVLDEDEFMKLWMYCLEDLKLPGDELRRVLMLRSRRLLRKKTREFMKKMIITKGNKSRFPEEESNSRLFAELTPERLLRLGKLIVLKCSTPMNVIK